MARLKIARRLRLLFAALLLIAVVTVGWISWPRDRQLLKVAHRVADATDWSVDRGPDACICYGWLSDHEVLFCKGSRVSNGDLYRRDVVTDRQEELTALTKWFHKTHGEVDGLSISPDHLAQFHTA